MRWAIVIAADAGYFDYAKGTVLSIRHKGGNAAPMFFFDVGLAPGQRDWLEHQGCTVLAPDWDIAFPGQETSPAFFRAMTARPHIPHHVPGFDLYFWIDADAWVQDWAAVETYLAAAEEVGAAFTPEIDRAYSYFWDGGHAKRWMRGCYERAFGLQAADAYGELPIVNSGVFAARANSPLWPAWQAALTEALQRTRDFYVEQTALNYAIYEKGIPAAFLPSWCNWHATFGKPKLETASGALLSHLYPPTRIGIVHLCGNVKKDNPAEIETEAGDRRRVDLRYPRWRE